GRPDHELDGTGWRAQRERYTCIRRGQCHLEVMSIADRAAEHRGRTADGKRNGVELHLAANDPHRGWPRNRDRESAHRRRAAGQLDRGLAVLDAKASPGRSWNAAEAGAALETGPARLRVECHVE